MSRLLPLFPLQLVVFPGNDVPLHIFEERYREMVGEAEAQGTEFGIILAKDGGVVNAGCTVRVETVLHRYDDGRFDVMTRGERRFELQSLDQEKAYLRGEVKYFDDDDWGPVTPEVRDAAMRALTNLQQAMAELGEKFEAARPDPEHPLLSFQLAQMLDDLDFQSQILRSRSEADRLKQFTNFTKEYVVKQKYLAKMKKVIPTNGHGHKHSDH